MQIRIKVKYYVNLLDTLSLFPKDIKSVLQLVARKCVDPTLLSFETISLCIEYDSCIKVPGSNS